MRPGVIGDGADEVTFLIVAVGLRVTVMTSPGGLAAVNTFQAENEVFVCHDPGRPVLPKGWAAEPELQGKRSGVGPTKGSETMGAGAQGVRARGASHPGCPQRQRELAPSEGKVQHLLGRHTWQAACRTF